MPQLGTEDYAKYPFLEEVRNYLKPLLDMTLEELEEYPDVILSAKDRVIKAYRGGFVKELSPIYENELLSFYIALLLVKILGVEHVAVKFALAEARRVEHFLEQEGKKDLVAYIFKVVTGVDAEEVQQTLGGVQYEYRIPIIEYLKRAVHLHSPEWKLVNRVVDGGFVYLTTHSLSRLIREEISSMIYSRIKSLPQPKPTLALQEAVEDLRKVIKVTTQTTPSRVEPSNYPPCVQHALDLLQKGQSIPHFGRFLLAAYLLTIGKSVEEVVSLFARAPDFNERLTRYQVEHIAGLRGGGTKYTPPSCRTIQAHTLCFKTDACDDIKNPLQFGRRRAKGGLRKRTK